MQVELFDSIANPQILKAKRVVIRSDHGLPIGVFVELQPGVYQGATHTDRNFDTILDVLGIARTEVTIETIKPPQLADFNL